VVLRESERKNLVFIFPTLILNFRRALFNATASLLLELATDVFPLSAYCEHEECLKDSFYTYRYYLVDGKECPALYFDPLIIVGGDERKAGSEDPNYCSRCDDHHVLPGKEYTYLTLKPLGLEASRGDLEPLTEELRKIKEQEPSSGLYRSFEEHYVGRPGYQLSLNALNVDHIPERALVFLYAEENLLSEAQLRILVDRLDLNREYLGKRLRDNRRPLEL
ncbi:MAG: thymidine kinase, partial [Spirochaetota bacterium]